MNPIAFNVGCDGIDCLSRKIIRVPSFPIPHLIFLNKSITLSPLDFLSPENKNGTLQKKQPIAEINNFPRSAPDHEMFGANHLVMQYERKG